MVWKPKQIPFVFQVPLLTERLYFCVVAKRFDTSSIQSIHLLSLYASIKTCVSVGDILQDSHRFYIYRLLLVGDPFIPRHSMPVVRTESVIRSIKKFTVASSSFPLCGDDDTPFVFCRTINGGRSIFNTSTLDVRRADLAIAGDSIDNKQRFVAASDRS